MGTIYMCAQGCDASMWAIFDSYDTRDPADVGDMAGSTALARRANRRRLASAAASNGGSGVPTGATSAASGGSTNATGGSSHSIGVGGDEGVDEDEGGDDDEAMHSRSGNSGSVSRTHEHQQRSAVSAANAAMSGSGGHGNGGAPSSGGGEPLSRRAEAIMHSEAFERACEVIECAITQNEIHTQHLWYRNHPSVRRFMGTGTV